MINRNLRHALAPDLGFSVRPMDYQAGDTVTEISEEAGLKKSYRHDQKNMLATLLCLKLGQRIAGHQDRKPDNPEIRRAAAFLPFDMKNTYHHQILRPTYWTAAPTVVSFCDWFI